MLYTRLKSWSQTYKQSNKSIIVEFMSNGNSCPPHYTPRPPCFFPSHCLSHPHCPPFPCWNYSCLIPPTLAPPLTPLCPLPHSPPHYYSLHCHPPSKQRPPSYPCSSSSSSSLFSSSLFSISVSSSSSSSSLLSFSSSLLPLPSFPHHHPSFFSSPSSTSRSF